MKAELVVSANDPRLHDGKAFAIASVHRLADCGDGHGEIRGIGCEAILRPRVYDYLSAGNGGFLSALADAENDCVLSEENDVGDWRVLPQ